VRKIWTQYSEIAGWNNSEASSLESETREAISIMVRENHDENVFFSNVIRSATVHWALAMPVLSSYFKRFWETGVIAGNAADIQNLGESGRVNPLLAVSSAPSGRFAVHYGTDPLLGFHLASAFDDGIFPEQELEKRVVSLAKLQFREWCAALKDQVYSRTVEITFFSGDALRLCYELQASHNSVESIPNIVRMYTSPWTSTEMNLLELDRSPGRRLFDIIETSNLVDHVGMLNVLPAVVPLLSRQSTSVMFTNTLLRAAKDITLALPALLCSDVTTISLILGLAPTLCLFPYTAHAVGLEEMVDLTASKDTGLQSQYHIGISWRVPTFADSIEAQNSAASCYQLVYQYDQLAKYFFKLYLTMFRCEDMESLMKSLKRRTISPLSIDLQHYTRMTFVIVLSLAKSRVHTDWTACMKSLLSMIQADRQLLVGSNSVQEIYLLFHLFGLFTSDILQKPAHNIGRTPYGQPRVCHDDPGLLGREDVPSIVYLALTVPRQKLDIFTKVKDPRGTPGVHVSVRNIEQGFDNSFFAIQCFFGQLVTHPTDNTTCDVLQDEHGWRGAADLIVTCAVPTWSMLLGAKKNLRVALTISSTPFTSQYISVLGARMSVFECGLDSHNLRFLTGPPGVLNNCQKWYLASEKAMPPEMEMCLVTLDENSCARTLRVRKPSGIEKYVAMPVVTQISPCTLTVDFGSSAPISLSFPYPINGEQHDTKLVSGAVELKVSIASSLSHGGYDYNIFPMQMCERQPIPLLMPSLNLDKQPWIPILGEFDWIKHFMGLMLSSRERKLHEDTSVLTADPLLQLKSSINAIFQSFTGANPHHGRYQTFQLVCKHKNNSSDTLLFASALRHNSLHGSLLLDAYVVPLSRRRVSKLSEELKHLVGSGQMLSIVLKSREEEMLWKKLLPVQVECCRQTWHHKDDCQYCSEGLIPLSLDHSQLPICSCGESQDISGFPRFQNWRAIANYATRIAIIPLSAIPCLERFMSREQEQDVGVVRARRTKGIRDDYCDNCGQSATPLKKCSRCRSVSYCNRDCQKLAWKAHKKECGVNRSGAL
jgi:hypothetical protein